MTGGPQGQVPGQENCPGAATASAASSGAYTSYVTASGTAAPGQQLDDVELTRLLNADRLATYVRACHGDQDAALRLYAWNVEVASAFWGSFNVLEVALRNRIAHHEPIFARNLTADHDRLLDILGAISPVAVDWVTKNSRVPQTISRRNDVVTGTQSTTF